MKKILLLLMVGLPLQGAVFTVINTNDSGAGSLRQAILDANTAGGNSTINFNIPGSAPQVIVPTTFDTNTAPRAHIYQPLTNDSITIDATTQPGYVFGSPSVIINCATIESISTNNGVCLLIQGANSCIIKGIGICNSAGTVSISGVSIENTATNGATNNQITQCYLGSIPAVPPFGNTRGIVISGRFTPTVGNAVTNNIIGGPGATDGNILSGNSVAGLQLQLSVTGTMIENNFIGCDSTGTIIIDNGEGINLLGDQPGVGQSGPCNNNTIQNNVVSGNTNTAIVLQGNVNNNTIQNNRIGTNAAGTALLGATAGPGVLLNGDASDTCNGNIVQNNIIGGNAYGIALQTNASSNRILANYIGTNSAGTNLGNFASGILIEGLITGSPCSLNLIENNVIAYNGYGAGATDFYGVFIDSDPTTPDIMNAILNNSIYSNNNNGIELANDGNDNQAPPAINTATLNANLLTVNATAPATPAASTFLLQFFVNSVNRNPITEGQQFVGSIDNVPSGQTVEATFTVPMVNTMNFATATATDHNGSGISLGDTSPFAINGTVTNITTPLSPLIIAILNKYCMAG